MKRITLILSFLTCVLIANAQVKFEENNLKLAIAKAKAENKIVFLMASSTG